VIAGNHHWLEDDVNSFAVGATAGSARYNAPYLEVDLLLTDPDTVAAVERGELPEISAAYQADIVFEKGMYNEKYYDALQSRLAFNHICLLPPGCGRAGEDVRILNRKGGIMPSKTFQNGQAKAFAQIQAKLREHHGDQEDSQFEANMDPHEATQAALRAVMSARPTDGHGPQTAADVQRMFNAGRQASKAAALAVQTKRISDLARLGFINSSDAIEQVDQLRAKVRLNRSAPLTHEEKMARIGFGR
jgi:hypothetical protein